MWGGGIIGGGKIDVIDPSQGSGAGTGTVPVSNIVSKTAALANTIEKEITMPVNK
jgi:hypothetical protein